jgi:hypothetical protein
MTDDDVRRLRPPRHRLFLIFNDVRLRPPVLEEMMPDLQRVIASVSREYCDVTSPHLQFDELTGVGNLKLAELITKGALEKQTCRSNFFKYFKSSFHNCVRSLVQKYRFTEKRTGQKPPPRAQRFLPANRPAPAEEEDGERVAAPEYRKNVDLSLDDPDLGLQVPDQHDNSALDLVTEEVQWNFSEAAAEYAPLFTDVEKLVFREMIAPGAKARVYAELEARRGKARARFNVKIKWAHMAEAIGMTTPLFQEAVLSIRNKIELFRMATPDQQDSDARRSALIAQLKQVFGVQIPPDIDSMVVRRLLTMAARDQFDKLNPQINEMLTEVGAKVPHLVGDGTIACYGVLYQKNCRQCNTCDLRHSCNVEAANLGLTKMAISPRLLGSRQMRVPAFLPRPASEVARQISTADEAEIINHLDETFRKMERGGKVQYYHEVGAAKTRRFLFCMENPAPLKLRFCTPSETLKKRLDGKQKTWFPPEDTSLAEMIELIEQHGRETFN